MKHLGSAKIGMANRIVVPQEVMEETKAKQGDELQFWKNKEDKIIVTLPVPPEECAEASG